VGLREQVQWGNKTTVVGAARWAIARYVALGIPMKHGNRLERAIQRIEEAIASGTHLGAGGESFTSTLAGAYRTTVEHYIIGRAVPAAQSGTVVRKIRESLAGTDLPATDGKTQPRDPQMELFSASILALAGRQVRFAEPNLVIDGPATTAIGVAVERSPGAA
jgi:hypothetical protein